MTHVNLDAIPGELKTVPQWVTWRIQTRDGKATKVPYSPLTGENASSTDKETWGTFNQAVDAWVRKSFDGIGFVFTPSDPYVGIDLDKCLDADGSLADWASEYVEGLESYTELSPSGTGIHIITKGKLPPGSRRKGPIEMYSEGRYFTVTGNRWPKTPAVIAERTDRLEFMHSELFPPAPVAVNRPVVPTPVTNLDDRAIIEKARAARNGAEFDALWRGDWQGAGFSSQSEADLKLCNALAFWLGGDEYRIDSMFRQSGLMRDKWDTRHYNDGRTYGAATIAKATAGTTNHYGSKPSAPVLTIITNNTPTDETDAEPDTIKLEFPPLPDAAMAVYAHASACAQWLDDYISFASAAAPKAPRSFHEAAGLFAGAVTVARRLRLHVGNTYIYPNLYIFFTADSTIYSKSTAFRVLEETFKAADMRHYLLPTPKTSEALLQELSMDIPNGYHNASDETRQNWLKERAFAASRGWTMDEAQGLFDSFKRDFSAGLMAVMLRLYESPDVTTEQTVSRWRVTVQRASLSFFGASTPAAMGEHFANRTLWNNGLFPRFALVVPDEAPRRVFWQSIVPTPVNVVRGLQRLGSLFPTPRAVIESTEDNGEKRQQVALYDDAEPSEAVLGEGVWQAWEAYSLATGYDLLNAGHIEPDLYSAYGRLGTHAIKVAMILATMDAAALPIRIELRHFARAQMIVEGWRTAMHNLRTTLANAPKESLADRMLAMLLGAGAAGLSTREVYRPLHIDDEQAIRILEGLERQGQAGRTFRRAKNGRMVETWVHADFVVVEVAKSGQDHATNVS